jgi:septal ring factor EnvC (AmiA/AmiB activator)
MTKQNNKVMVGFRMNPELKEVIMAEIKQRDDISFSAYLEEIVVNRAHNSADIDKMKEKIFELESTIAELHQQNAKVSKTSNPEDFDAPNLSKELMEKGLENRMLKQRNAELNLSLNNALKERDVAMKINGKPIPHWISTNGYDLLVQMVAKIQSMYPHHTYEQVLLSSVGMVDYNEKEPTFIISTLDMFWKSNTNFLNNLKQKQSKA